MSVREGIEVCGDDGGAGSEIWNAARASQADFSSSRLKSKKSQHGIVMMKMGSVRTA